MQWGNEAASQSWTDNLQILQNLHKKYPSEDFPLAANPFTNKPWCLCSFGATTPKGAVVHARLWSWQQTLSCIYRRARRCPRGRKEKLMLARRETTLQKMEMPKQTRYPSSSIDSLPSRTGTGPGLWGVGEELNCLLARGCCHMEVTVLWIRKATSKLCFRPQMFNLISLKIRAVQPRGDLFCSGFCCIERWVSIF